MWRVALAGLVMACGGAATEVRSTGVGVAASVTASAAETRATELTTTELSTTEPCAMGPCVMGPCVMGPAAAESCAMGTGAAGSTEDPHDVARAHGSAALTSAPTGSRRPDRDAIRDPNGAPMVASPARPEVRCAHPARCPASVGLVVFPGQTPDLTGRILEVRCTGTLVAPDRVLTASHCVTTPTCRDGWVAFPATAEHPAANVRCARVLAQDPDDADAVLLEDWVLLQVEAPVARPVATVEPAPVAPGTIVTVASVTPHAIYDRQHELDVRLCRVETSEQAEARLGLEARRVGWLSGCPIAHGNSGSPVLDQHGRVRALVHAGSHPVFGIGVTTALPSQELGRDG